MNDGAWWARVVQARTERDGLRPHRVLALRKDGHEAAIDLKARCPASAPRIMRTSGRRSMLSSRNASSTCCG